MSPTSLGSTTRCFALINLYYRDLESVIIKIRIKDIINNFKTVFFMQVLTKVIDSTKRTRKRNSVKKIAVCLTSIVLSTLKMYLLNHHDKRYFKLDQKMFPLGYRENIIESVGLNKLQIGVQCRTWQLNYFFHDENLKNLEKKSESKSRQRSQRANIDRDAKL